MKIVEYKTIVYDKLLEFNTACNNMIADGYDPIGGVSMNQYAYGQSFVMYAKSNKKILFKE